MSLLYAEVDNSIVLESMKSDLSMRACTSAFVRAFAKLTELKYSDKFRHDLVGNDFGELYNQIDLINLHCTTMEFGTRTRPMLDTEKEQAMPFIAGIAASYTLAKSYKFELLTAFANETTSPSARVPNERFEELGRASYIEYTLSAIVEETVTKHSTLHIVLFNPGVLARAEDLTGSE
jgi:hypothetical protein